MCDLGVQEEEISLCGGGAVVTQSAVLAALLSCLLLLRHDVITNPPTGTNT